MFEMSFMWTRENMAFAYINDYISANVNEGKAKKKSWFPHWLLLSQHFKKVK